MKAGMKRTGKYADIYLYGSLECFVACFLTYANL